MKQKVRTRGRFGKLLSFGAALIMGTAAFLGASCTSCAGRGDKDGYDPKKVDSSVVESSVTDGVRYAEDSLGGKEFLYRLKGSDAGLVPDVNENSTQKLQAALDRIYTEHGGGLLYLEKGVYKIFGKISLPKNTGIVGDWVAPVGENAARATEGTVLEINFGLGNDSSAREDAAIITMGNNRLMGLTIAYANQNPKSPKKYPFTLANSDNKGFFAENLTFLNSYRGILIDNQNVYTLKNIYMTALNEGIRINYNYDIPELYNVNISYKYWAQSGAYGAPAAEDVRAATRTATAFSFGRIDWIYLDTSFVEGYDRAYYYYRNNALSDEIREANGQYLYMNCADCKYGIYVDTTSSVGNIYTRCDLSVTGEGSAAVYFSSNVVKDASGADNYNTAYQFNSCTFESDEGCGIESLGKVAVDAVWSEFKAYGDAGLKATDGSYILDRCEMKGEGTDVELSATVQTAKLINCDFGSEKKIDCAIAGEQRETRFIEANEDYAAEIEKYGRERYVPAEVREPSCKNIYYASDYGAKADGNLNNSGGTDNTEAIQHALNAAGANGGGYVVLEQGFYRVDNRLLVPAGVHLVGNAISNRHFVGRKEAATLITGYGKDKGRTDHGFITLEDDSAVRGLCVYYAEQDVTNPVKYSPTVSVEGDNAQVANTIFIGGYVNFYITGENALISYARGLGLDAGLVAEGINSGRFEYMFFSINDWMRSWDNEVPNAPPEGWHSRYPNFDNDTFVFENCSNVTLYHSFSYGQGTGLRLEGKVENFHGIGVGIDMGRSSLILNNSGTGNVFVNTEFTSAENNILTRDGFSGEVTLYNSNNWFSLNGVTSTFDGPGKVNIQQFHMQKGSFTANGGIVNLQGLLMDDMAGPAVVVGKNAKGGAINSLGGINGFLTDGSAPGFVIKNCTGRRFANS